jgi:hypothetical protein
MYSEKATNPSFFGWSSCSMIWKNGVGWQASPES